MLLSKIHSVQDAHFQHKQLTKVHGKPLYKSLQKLTTELKANAASVPSTNGGGLYGHLGLIVSCTQYATFQHSIPWKTPFAPGMFTALVTTSCKAPTATQLDAAKDDWKEHKASFNLCQATEKALIAQIIKAIDPIYICPLLNHTTGQCANSPMTPQQLIDMAYIIFAKQPILQPDLHPWSRKPLTDRTWPNMLTHFLDAQTDLRTIPTANDLYPHNPVHNANVFSTMANLVAQRLLDAMPPTDESFSPVPPDNTINTAIQQCGALLAACETTHTTQVQELMAQMRMGTARMVAAATTATTTGPHHSPTTALRQAHGPMAPVRTMVSTATRINLGTKKWPYLTIRWRTVLQTAFG